MAIAEKLSYLEDTKKAIKAAIIEKGTDVPEGTTFRSYADKIKAISGGGGGAEPPAEAFVLTGDCSNWGGSPVSEWFFNTYKNKMSSKDITASDNMLEGIKTETIPFELNFKSIPGKRCFYRLGLEQAPVINISPNLKSTYDYDFSAMFALNRFTEVPQDYFKNIFNIDRIKYNNGLDLREMFAGNSQLKKSFNLNFLYGLNNSRGLSSAELYRSCRFIKDIDLPIFKKFKSSGLYTLTYQNHSVRSLTFDKNREYYDGAVLGWNSMTLATNQYGGTGYVDANSNGFLDEKRIYDEVTYAALKNDPDAWADTKAYSFYNHDSAVETINSLPNTSGANTIVFTGTLGSLTDGGAISTLTPDEIAVATNKGFTVTIK